MTLKSIEEHENNFQENYQSPGEESDSGFACPSCGTEMMIDNTQVLLSNPPQSKLRCPKCGKVSSVH